MSKLILLPITIKLFLLLFLISANGNTIPPIAQTSFFPLISHFQMSANSVVYTFILGEQRAESKDIFDLSGRKLSKITQPGIYIINGKKVLVN